MTEVGYVSLLRTIGLNNDDTFSIEDMGKKLDVFYEIAQTMENFNQEAKLEVVSLIRSFVSCACHYYQQQGKYYWSEERNIDELFKFLTLLGDTLFIYAAIQKDAGKRIAAPMAAKDGYAIFPPEHRQVNEFRKKILNFLGAAFSYNIQETNTIYESSSYMWGITNSYMD
ncbi:hypothetical protein D3H55_10025 [Bacillus salacetis]|uniref:Uncharacterized protein n=1 Tax=Bacillus salacetis TaxID=2315464 RepID=A0A3A1R549_9BACI|nr:hypothetical protein [Bacillus salacetis]RIW34304.1 hypothetical protein D3H55_10025 [Bacillus salacetis]